MSDKLNGVFIQKEKENPKKSQTLLCDKNIDTLNAVKILDEVQISKSVTEILIFERKIQMAAQQLDISALNKQTVLIGQPNTADEGLPAHDNINKADKTLITSDSNEPGDAKTPDGTMLSNTNDIDLTKSKDTLRSGIFCICAFHLASIYYFSYLI